MLRPRHAADIALACLLAAALALPALAGEADAEPDDSHEHGAPFFGEAKDIGGLEPVPEVRIKAQVKGTMRFFITQTDDEGRFRRAGMGPDVDPEAVEVTCEKTGFRTVEVLRRRASKDKLAPVEIECLLEKIK